MPELTIRQVVETDVVACHAIESQCFSPAQAATMDRVRQRQARFPQGFLVAETDGRVVGFINSGATDDPEWTRDEFKALAGHDASGSNMVVFSLAVDPDHQGTGVSRLLLSTFVETSRKLDKDAVFLLCKAELVSFYRKFGFVDRGQSSSAYGGSTWHEMELALS